MKTAVSVPDDVFARADALAAERGMSRSQVYTEALREYLEHHGADDPVTAKLDELADRADRADPSFGTVTARRLIEGGHWTW